MKRLRISGLVGLAKRVRQELAGPVSDERLAHLRQEVESAVTGITQICREKGIRLQSLPAPSRKALQFLQGLDWDAVVPEEAPAGSRFPPDSLSFRGLPRYFDNLLKRLAQNVDHPELEKIYETLAADSHSLEDDIRRNNIRPEQLKKQARELRGWFAYFAQRANFERYCAAVRRAEPVFRETCPWPAAKTAAVLVRFRPMRGMYRVRGYADAIVVDLPTPMICFDRDLLRSVAQIAFKKGGDRQAVHNATAGEAHRRIDAAIELLGGVVTQMRGLHHDLAESFDRVNTQYFGGAMNRPRLVWSRTFAVRKYGHYDHAHDTVMVNAALDRGTVPACAVDFIVYHELLHRQLGITWKSNRIAAHTADFAEKERQFRQYDEAKAVLRELASER